MSNRITLERFNYALEGTYGRLKLLSGAEMFTIERPYVMIHREVGPATLRAAL